MAKGQLSGVTKEQLAALYADKSTYQIGLIFGCNEEAVRKKLIAFGIPRRRRGGWRTFNPSREELAALYQEFSMNQIAKRFDVGETVVWKRLNEYGIKLRDFENGGHRKKPGREFSSAHKTNISKALRGRWSGEDHPNWKGGRTEEMLKLRRSGAYKQWKREALELRSNQCERCGVKQGFVCHCCGHKVSLHVHHVESFTNVPERRFDPTNSEVLCSKCHHEHHHGKSGELLETPNVKTRAISSEAAEGKGSAERSTTRLTSPNSN
jgi:5-methylcytosine-specific restriction endonuclease McrA